MITWLILIVVTVVIGFVINKFILKKPNEIASPTPTTTSTGTTNNADESPASQPRSVPTPPATDERETSNDSDSTTFYDNDNTEDDKSYLTFESEVEYSELPELTDDQKKKTAPLTARDLKLFTLKSKTIELKPGEILLTEGEPNTEIFQHLSGKLAVQKHG